jgi:hypothetical protein
MHKRTWNVLKSAGLYASIFATAVTFVVEIVSFIFVWPVFVGLIAFGAALFLGAMFGFGWGYHTLQKNQQKLAAKVEGQVVSSKPGSTNKELKNLHKKAPQTLIPLRQNEAKNSQTQPEVPTTNPLVYSYSSPLPMTDLTELTSTTSTTSCRRP